MKKRIVLKRIFHRERWRYGIFFDYDQKLISLLRQVNGAAFSKSNKCWYVDDTEENLKHILTVLSDNAEIDISAISSESNGSNRNIGIPQNPEKGTLPAPASVQVQSFSKGDRYGTIDLTPEPEKIKEVHGKGYGPVEFTINESDGRLIIRFTGRYDKEWIKELKSYGRANFDPERLEWLLDWSRMKVDSLSDYFSSRGIEVIVKRTEVAPELKEKREDHGSEIRDRRLSDEALIGIEKVRRHLNESRYSNRTVDCYISLLELFFKYFSGVNPAELREDDISDFFHDYISYHNYSRSYHNQLISAIKVYYKLNGSGDIDSSNLGRPRRTRTLPKVFSKEEVKKILNSTRNNKHMLILWIIYSCGLRRSEVINIKLKDLDRERGILNIREAKGMADRIVPVPVMVWEKIEEYKLGYRPAYWLFEGQTGGKYSAESVYRVFKQALKTAGIRKDVGVHCLRHSYATHLHENGLDIRYIQELLGHRSSRTTEIYTHVSRRNLMQVRSPIEDLGLK